LGCTQEQADQALGGVVLRAWRGAAQAPGRPSARRLASRLAPRPSSPTTPLPNSAVFSENTHNASTV